MITTKQIGDNYEYFVLDHIKNDFDNVWHWKNVPEYVLYELNIIRDYNIFSKYRYDIGADLVAKKDNTYYFIQCKNYKDTITIDHLAGFYFLLYEYGLNGILYYNGNLSHRIKELSTRKINFINLPYNNQTFITNTVPNIKLIPKDYQIEAYNTLKNYDKSILSLPCGMGKTFTASILATNYDNIIILSPLRYLAQQLLINMTNYLENRYNPILISMDGSRNIETIIQYIKDKNIFSCTYDSADVMLKLLDRLNNTYLIIDEFHNLPKNETNNINQIMNKLDKHLYLSATPIKDFKCDYKYVYKWKDAIDNSYICDFDIIIHDDNKELYDFVSLINRLCSSLLDRKLIAKSYFILKGLMYYGNRKCICYMTNTDKAGKINDILFWMSKFLNIKLDTWIITYNTSKRNRDKYLSEFKKSNNLSIMVNVHILDEGIDIAECDSVYITQPNNNIINIVQRMCRANRITENKKRCQIYLWCSKNKTNKILEYLSDNTESVIDNKVFKARIIDNSVTLNSYKINGINTVTNQNNIKITNYLKSNSIIDRLFIDDFYSFYDNGQNEYDYTINLEKVAFWLEVRKDNIKTLLESNFTENQDYILYKNGNGKGMGIGYNKRKHIMLRYTCAKELCMLSRSEKSSSIRKCFIELEKLIMLSFSRTL